MSKSMLLLSFNISVEMVNSLSSKFGIPRTLDLGAYLGMPLLHKRLVKAFTIYLLRKNVEIKQLEGENYLYGILSSLNSGVFLHYR